MRLFVCKRDGMWVVTSREGQHRYLSLRWAMKHARTVAKRKPRSLEGAPYVWHPQKLEAGMWDELRRLGFAGGSPEGLNVGWESYGKPGGILDGSDPGWRVLDPGYPANRTAPAVMA